MNAGWNKCVRSMDPPGLRGSAVLDDWQMNCVMCMKRKNGNESISLDDVISYAVEQESVYQTIYLYMKKIPEPIERCSIAYIVFFSVESGIFYRFPIFSRYPRYGKLDIHQYGFFFGFIRG